jgi:hypothetical protein
LQLAKHVHVDGNIVFSVPDTGTFGPVVLESMCIAKTASFLACLQSRWGQWSSAKQGRLFTGVEKESMPKRLFFTTLRSTHR